MVSGIHGVSWNLSPTDKGELLYMAELSLSILSELGVAKWLVLAKEQQVLGQKRKEAVLICCTSFVLPQQSRKHKRPSFPQPGSLSEDDIEQSPPLIYKGKWARNKPLLL